MRLILWLSLLMSAALQAQIPTLELNLIQAIARAKANSERLKSVNADWHAAKEREATGFTALLPRLTLDGNYHYVSVVPALQAFPNTPAIQLGAHSNYSIGPTLSYTLWDGGAAHKSYKSSVKASEASREDERVQTAQLVASVKLAYLQTQLGLEQVQLVADSLKLAQAQHKDIANRKKAGAASQLEFLTAQKEVLSYELQFKQQEIDLSASVRDLLALLHETRYQDIQHPAPPGFAKASLWLRLDSLEKAEVSEGRHEPTNLDELPPQLKSQDLMAESLDWLAKSATATLYPQLLFSARTSLDYPNGPILQQINQNTLSVGLAMPLYEFNRTQHLAAEKDFEAQATRYRRQQLESDIQRDFAKSKAALVSLRAQQIDAEDSVKQSESLAHLNYEAYRFGNINLTEVQAANLRALQAKVDLARIRAGIIRELILLKTIVAKED